MSFLDQFINNLHSALYHNEEALNYLHTRKVTDEEIRLFNIGFSRVTGVVDDGSEDYQCFLKETRSGRAFESKIILPLYDLMGNAVGMLGRSLASKEFKFYLTLEGKYSGAFFGLIQALPTIYETGKVYTVEGPFDLLAFRKVYPNSVATMTAELTEAQYGILNMFAKNIITVFDSDIPGRKASERASKWKNVKEVCLGWKDPDAGLKYLEFEKFKKHVQKKVEAVSLFL